MNEEQFNMLIQKLDWIGGSLENLQTMIRDNYAYPRQVQTVPREGNGGGGWQR